MHRNATGKKPSSPPQAGGSLFLCALIAAGSVVAQSLPEPPLPVQPSREVRAAAAAVQAPKNLRPPPPIPDQPVGSPIPPQVPDSAAPPQPSRPAADNPPGPPSQLPTGFTSKITSSTSGSGQFKIYGKDLQTRSPFSSRCDEIAERLSRLLHDSDPWVLPVVVAIKTPPDVKLSGPAVSTSISQITNGGFHLQVTIQVRPDLRPTDIDAEITRILIAERILRNQTGITTKRSMVLPEWLLTGITQAMSFRDRSRPSAVFAAIFHSGKIYSIEEILDAAPGQLDALSRTIYETSCCALVLTLLDQTEGPASLRKFLSLLAVDSRDDRALLNFCFPRLALSGPSLNKWWSLQMASLATPSVFETLGPTDTRKALTQALTIHYETTADSAPKTKTIIAEADEPPADAPTGEKKHGLFGRIFSTGAPAESTDKPGEEKADPAKKKTDEPLAKTKPDTADEPADESAQEEKKKGIFGRMFGGSGGTPEEPAAAEKEDKKPEADTAAKPAPKKTETPKEKDKPVAEAEPALAKKQGLFGRMFGGTGATTGEAANDSKDEKKTESPAKPEPEPKSEEKPRENAKPAAEDDPAAEKKTGLLGRMFSGAGTATSAPDKDSKDEKKTEPAEKPEPKKAEKPKPEPRVEEKPKETPVKKAVPAESTHETAEPKKRGFLGRMFGGSAAAKPEEQPDKKTNKKPDAEESDSESKADEKKKSAAAAIPPDSMLAMRDQVLAMSGEWIAAAAAVWHDFTATSGHEVKLRIGFGRKKTDEAEKPAEETDKEKPKADKPKEEKPAEAPKKKSARAKAEPEPEKKAVPEPKPKAKTETSKPRLVPVSIPIEDYANIMKRKDRATILEDTSRALSALVPRANVLFRPIINDYISVVGDLQTGKTKDMDQRLATLRSRATNAYEQAKAVEDHLDVFEANETKNYSGAFEDYLKLPEQIEKELPVRDDPLSRYLDALDLEFGK